MPLQAQTIVSYACQVAKCPAFTSQAGDFLNMILNELCHEFNLDVARASSTLTFNSGAGTNQGPYTLPTNWLRSVRNDIFYTIQGVPYKMIPIELAEFDGLVEQAGLNAYPQNYAIDTSPIATQSAPLMWVWPPPSGSYVVSLRYFSQMPDITTPASSSVVPWFPKQQYLKDRLTAEMMQLTGDERALSLLGKAQADLEAYLKQQGEADVVKTVTLDRRRFGTAWDRLPFTKIIGW
jgi:hypothetical protein